MIGRQCVSVSKQKTRRVEVSKLGESKQLSHAHQSKQTSGLTCSVKAMKHDDVGMSDDWSKSRFYARLAVKTDVYAEMSRKAVI